MSERIREPLAVTLAVLGVLLAVAAIGAWYVDQAVFDRDEFADRAVGALEEPEVQTAIAAGVADAVIAQEPELISARPVIEFGAQSLIGTESFEAIFRTAAREAHSLFFDEQGGVVLQFGDLGVLLSSVIAANNPEVAAEIPKELTSGLVVISERKFAEDTIVLSERFETLTWTLTVLALLALIGALIVSQQRRRLVAVIGLGITLAAIVAIVVLSVLEERIVDSFEQPDVVRAVWGAYVGDLTRVLLIVAAASVIVTGAAASLLWPLMNLPAVVRAIVTRLVRRPRTPAVRLARGVAIIVAGVLIALNPLAAAELVALFVGAALLFLGVAEALGVINERASTAGVSEAKGVVRGAIRLGVGWPRSRLR